MKLSLKYIAMLLMFIAVKGFSQENIIKQRKTIPFTLTPNGHIMIEAKINGVSGNFIFDTGAGINLLTKKFANKVESLEKTHHFYTGFRATGEQLQVDLWNSKELQLEDFTIKDEIFAVYDIDFPLDGLISLTPFTKQPITIDYTKKVLYVESKESYNNLKKEKDYEIPLQVSNDKDLKISIATKVIINDKLELNVGLDSGAGSRVYRLNSRYMKNLGVDSTKVKSVYKPSYFKPKTGNTYYFTKLSSLSDKKSNTTVKDFNATFIDGLIYEGIMSIDWLGDVITIDILNKKIIVNND